MTLVDPYSKLLLITSKYFGKFHVKSQATITFPSSIAEFSITAGAVAGRWPYTLPEISMVHFMASSFYVVDGGRLHKLWALTVSLSAFSKLIDFLVVYVFPTFVKRFSLADEVLNYLLQIVTRQNIFNFYKT